MAKKKAGNAFLWIIMLLLIVGLAGFGATNFGGSVRTVATVGDTEVVADDYARALQGQMSNYSRLTGQQMTFSQAAAIGFDRSALSQVVADAALRNATAEAGLSVGDENISREIVEMPGFQGLGGTFDRQTYELTLRQNGVDPREFEARVRDSIASGILERAVSGGVETPSLFIDTLYNFAREERDVTWARLGAEDLETPLSEPSDTELRAFHADNPEAFTQGETRAIDYAWLTPDMLIDDIPVEDAQLRELYNGRLDEYVQPERRLVERLVFSTDTDANDAKARLDAGEVSFDDLVAERDLTLDDVDLGDATQEDLGDAAEAIFAMAEPGVAGPLPSPFGPALYRMNAILAAQETTFEEARADLASEAASDRARRIILESVAQVEDLLAGGATASDLADRTDLRTGQIKWRVDITDGIAGYDAFRAAAASAVVGGFPEVVELDDGGIFALWLTEIVPPALRPFEDVRDEVVAAWEADAQQTALTAQAEAAADRLRGGAEMAGLGLALETDRDLQRSGFVEGTPPDFVDQVFDMGSGEVRVLSAAGEAWLVRLDAVRAPDPNTPEAQVIRLQFSQETSAELAQSLMAAFTQAVIEDTEVQINQAALAAVHTHLQ